MIIKVNKYYLGQHVSSPDIWLPSAHNELSIHEVCLDFVENKTHVFKKGPSRKRQNLHALPTVCCSMHFDLHSTKPPSNGILGWKVVAK